MRAALPLAAAALFAGCGPSEGFGRLGAFKLQSGVISFSNGVDTVFRYETESRGCQVLAADFSVTVDGAPVAVDVGGSHSDPTTGKEICEPPMFTIPRPRTVPATVSMEARSGGDVVTAQLEGLGMEIHGTPLLSPGAMPHLGETIRIALEPGWDQLTWPETGFIGTDNSVRYAQPAPVTAPVDGVLGVTIPEVFYPASYGPANAVVQVWARSTPRFTSCDAPLGCAIGADVTGAIVLLRFDLVVQP